MSWKSHQKKFTTKCRDLKVTVTSSNCATRENENQELLWKVVHWWVFFDSLTADRWRRTGLLTFIGRQKEGEAVDHRSPSSQPPPSVTIITITTICHHHHNNHHLSSSQPPTICHLYHHNNHLDQNQILASAIQSKKVSRNREELLGKTCGETKWSEESGRENVQNIQRRWLQKTLDIRAWPNMFWE